MLTDVELEEIGRLLEYASRYADGEHFEPEPELDLTYDGDDQPMTEEEEEEEEEEQEEENHFGECDEVDVDEDPDF